MNVVLEGDLVARLADLEAGTIDAVVTDPPYGIDFLGHAWDTHSTAVAFERWCTEWGRGLRRVMKPGAWMLAFGATRTFHRLTSGLEDAGFEVRDVLVWGYASGMPKDGNAAYRIDRVVCPLRDGHRSPNARLRDGEHHCERSEAGRPWEDWSTTLKPAWEPIVLLRAPTSLPIAANLLEHGVGALNIGGTRLPVDPNDPVHENTWTVAESAIRPGTAGFLTPNVPGERIPTAPKGGRWPSNVVLTDPLFEPGTPGVVAPPQTRSGGWPAERGPSDSYGGGMSGGSTLPPGAMAGTGSYNRFFLIPKADSADRNPVMGGANLHPTVKPIDLMRHLVRLVTPPGGVVLDPFMGSGTTAVAAETEGFRWLGIEREAEYVQMTRERLANRLRGLGL